MSARHPLFPWRPLRYGLLARARTMINFTFGRPGWKKSRLSQFKDCRYCSHYVISSELTTLCRKNVHFSYSFPCLVCNTWRSIFTRRELRNLVMVFVMAWWLRCFLLHKVAKKHVTIVKLQKKSVLPVNGPVHLVRFFMLNANYFRDMCWKSLKKLTLGRQSNWDGNKKG